MDHCSGVPRLHDHLHFKCDKNSLYKFLPSSILDVTQCRREWRNVFIRLTKEQQEQIIADIQRFFYNQREEDISDFEAQRVLDFVKENIAPYIYNAAISDAKYVVESQLSALDEELIALERPIKIK